MSGATIFSTLRFKVVRTLTYRICITTSNNFVTSTNKCKSARSGANFVGKFRCKVVSTLRHSCIMICTNFVTSGLRCKSARSGTKLHKVPNNLQPARTGAFRRNSALSGAKHQHTQAQNCSDPQNFVASTLSCKSALTGTNSSARAGAKSSAHSGANCFFMNCNNFVTSALVSTLSCKLRQHAWCNIVSTLWYKIA